SSLCLPAINLNHPAVTNSYKLNDNIGRQSFMLSKKFYNPINSQKDIESNVIVSYTNANGRYDSLKESLKKSVIFAIGRLKLSPNSKLPHIISSEIEWSYTTNEPKSSSYSSNVTSNKEYNNQLDMIEKQYTTISSQPPNKRKRYSFFSLSTKLLNNTLQTVNLEQLMMQIRTNQPNTQQTYEESSDKN
ncbi:11584_t:CDS:1, partial [Racocetra persica]